MPHEKENLEVSTYVKNIDYFMENTGSENLEANE